MNIFFTINITVFLYFCKKTGETRDKKDLNKISCFYINSVYWVCQIACHACLLRNVVSVPTYLRISGVYVPSCQKACQILVPINISTCHMRANDSTWTPNISNGVSIFWTFLLRIDKQNFYNLLLYKKFYMILDVIVIYIICIGIAHRNCVILHFYTSCHVKEKCLEFFFFIIFGYLARNENIKRPSFYSLQVTRAFSSFPQLNN